VRGTQRVSAFCDAVFRFIPARAGNTQWPPWTLPPRPVHPRACGEHGTKAVLARTYSGSSPRVRGTHIS